MTNLTYDEASRGEANFTLPLKLQEPTGQKADEGKPNATIEVKATSTGFALNLLRQLAENKTEYNLGEMAAFPEEDAPTSSPLKISDMKEFFISSFFKNRVPFTKFGMNVKGEYKSEPASASLILTAPSSLIAYNVFGGLIGSRQLTALVDSFPKQKEEKQEEDAEDDDWNSQPYLLIS